MAQLRKVSTFKMFLPTRAIAGAWYRLTGWSSEPATQLPENVMPAIAPQDYAFKNLSFTFAVIALSARVACADGKLTREKYVAFREAFPLVGGLCGKIRKLFSMACENEAPFETYVTQVKYIFPRQMDLFYSLVDRLFCIARADGEISRNEERMLARIAHLLELSAAEYTEIRDRHSASPKPHHVLGIEKKVSNSSIKKRYHTLMRQYHPDRFANENISPEVSMLLRLKTSEINEAYRALTKKSA